MNPSEKLRSVFSEMVVRKSPEQSKAFSALSIPSYLRDWLVKRFSDPDGHVDMNEIYAYIRETLPRRDDWEALKNRAIQGKTVRFLAKVQVEIDVKTGKGLYSLPDFGFPKRRLEAIIDDRVLATKHDDLLASSDAWGVIELAWRMESIGQAREEGHLVLTDFRPFRPYRTDPDYFRQGRREFALDEWIDLLLLAVDYNPAGYHTEAEKLAMLTRLLPFVEKRLNIIELAPKGTGKSYVFSQLSKYGWLVSGGSVSRPRMFYNIGNRTPGLVSRYDYVALDEVQSITFPEQEEMRGALKGYMESGEYRVGDYSGVGEAGIILLGNIDAEIMTVERDMLRDLPPAFHESALLDRFHGFIKGWDIPRMRENLKANGWALNTEYTTEILHSLRDDVRYRAIVDELLRVPRGADTRDTEAIKRLATAWLKLLFPHAVSEPVDANLFRQYCLEPSKEMRGTIRKQLHIMDSAEYSSVIPEITC
jgi:ATP-dependent Lon protease